MVLSLFERISSLVARVVSLPETISSLVARVRVLVLNTAAGETKRIVKIRMNAKSNPYHRVIDERARQPQLYSVSHACGVLMIESQPTVPLSLVQKTRHPRR